MPGIGGIAGSGMPQDQLAAQLAVISETQARDALPDIWKTKAYRFLNRDVLTNANCHGYTVHQTNDRELNPDEFLRAYTGAYIARVFVRGGKIGHSGRFNGTTLTHYIIGVGSLESDIGADLMGYEAAYTLPEQEDTLRIAVGIPKSSDEGDFPGLKAGVKMNLGEFMREYERVKRKMPEKTERKVATGTEKDEEEDDGEGDEPALDANEESTLKDGIMWEGRLAELETMEYSKDNFTKVSVWFDEASKQT